MTPIEIVKEIFPDISDQEADYILWSKTGFPSFFSGEETIEEQIRKQLLEYKVIVDSGEPCCELCNSVATVGYLCQNCEDALAKIRRGEGKDKHHEYKTAKL